MGEVEAVRKGGDGESNLHNHPLHLTQGEGGGGNKGNIS